MLKSLYWGLILALVGSTSAASADDSALRTNCYSGRTYGYPASTIISACHDLAKLPAYADDKIKAELFNIMGAAAQSDSDSAQAIKYYDEALRLEPNYNYPLQNKASILLSQNRCAEAYELYERRSKLPPDTYAGLFGMGEALACQEKFSEALKFYDDALVEAPHIESYFRSRARALLLMGDKKKASEDAEASARLNPTETSYGFHAALLLLAADEYDKANEVLNKYLQRSPGEPYGMMVQYLVNLRKGLDTRSILEKRYAQMTDPASWIRAIYGFLLGKVGESQLMQMSQGASDEQARIVDVYYYSGELELAKGNRSAALNHFKAVPQNEVTRAYGESWSARARIKQLSSGK